MSLISGNIPENITILTKGEKEVSFQWDDFQSTEKTTLTVVPAFVSDSTNKKTLETGRRWAKTARRKWDSATNKYIETEPILYEVDRLNHPMHGCQIVNLEHRGEGGRAYKVITTDQYYVDLREDVLMDIMMYSQIDKGTINCDLIFARVGTEMKLVRVGSELHDQLIERTEVRKQKPLKELKPGYRYETKGGDVRIFLGFVNTEEFIGDHKREYCITAVKEVKSIRKAYLWSKAKDWAQTLQYSFYTSLTTSHAMIKEVDSVVIPDDAIAIIRDSSQKELEARIATIQNTKPNLGWVGYSTYRDPTQQIIASICHYSQKNNMCPYPDNPMLSTKHQEYYDRLHLKRVVTK
jgi:hypothetical protein